VSKVNRKYLDLSTGTNGVNSAVIPTNYSPSNFTATDTYIKGSIQGIDNKLSTLGSKSAGDIAETSFSTTNNQSTPANVTGFAFANATMRSFKALVSVYIDATTDLFEAFDITGIQKGSGWALQYSSVGDNSGIVFTINASGQILYVSSNITGFSSGVIKFRASTLTV
jgi:hypothetical protein